MYLRCSSCHAPTWLRSLVPGAVEDQIECAECHESHDLSRANELGEDNKSQYETANKFATENGVDLPTAYSVLLGLMTLADARAADAAQREAARKAAAPAPAATTASDHLEGYDSPPPRRKRPQPRNASPAESADGGSPDRRQSQRRQRNRRKGDAADDITVHVERDMPDYKKRLTVGQAILLSILAILIFGLTGRYAFQQRAEMAAAGRLAEKNTAASAEAVRHAEEKKETEFRAAHADETTPAALQATVERDPMGRVIRISGSNPQIVLDAYCRELRDGIERRPLGLSQAAPPDASERFGVFQNLSQLETDHAIRISRDRETRRWVAGDGRGPIRTRPSRDGTALISSAAVRQP